MFDLSLKVHSKSRAKKTHYVRRYIDTGLLDCTCERWVFNRVHCSHMDVATATFLDPIKVIAEWSMGNLRVY